MEKKPDYIDTKPKPRKKRKDSLVSQDKYGVVKQRDKMDLFLEEYVKNGGNATRAAMKVFDTNSYRSAQSIGSIYLKRAKDIGRFVMEEKGYGLGKMLDIAIEKMEDSDTPEWWDRLAKIGGIADFMPAGKGGTAGQTVVNIVQNEKQIMSKYMDAELVEELTSIEGDLLDDDEDIDDNKNG